jgi:tartrate dehydrogenase/decarboxylase/D-malate dehydrogenase
VIKAIERVLADGTVRTPDMGGKASTQALGQAIVDAL